MERTSKRVIGAIAGAALGTGGGLLLIWAILGTWDLSISAMTGAAGTFVGAVYAQEEKRRGYVRSSLVGAIIGAIVGMAFGGAFGLVYAPRNWITMHWMRNMLLMGGSAGSIGGVVVVTIAWLLRRWTIPDQIASRVHEAVVKRALYVLLGTLVGAITGCITGIALEVAIVLRRLILSQYGFLFHIDDFTMAVYLVPGIGAVLGAAWGFLGGVTNRAIRRMIIGIVSGTVFSISVGIVVGVTLIVLFTIQRDLDGSVVEAIISIAGILAISALILGLPVGLIGQLITMRLVSDIYAISYDDQG